MIPEVISNEGTPSYGLGLSPVFPSNNITVWATAEPDYADGPAHQFKFQNSLGFNNGEAQYAEDSYQTLQFVQKNPDGSMTPGLQTEQLLIAIYLRHKSLNDKFPSEQGEAFLAHIAGALQLQKDRVLERMNRGVMGELKK